MGFSPRMPRPAPNSKLVLGFAVALLSDCSALFLRAESAGGDVGLYPITIGCLDLFSRMSVSISVSLCLQHGVSKSSKTMSCVINNCCYCLCFDVNVASGSNSMLLLLFFDPWASSPLSAITTSPFGLVCKLWLFFEEWNDLRNVDAWLIFLIC